MLLTPNEVQEANSYGEMLRLAVHERSIPATLRNRGLAGAIPSSRSTIMQSQLCLRMDCTRWLPPFRPSFDSYVRGGNVIAVRR